MKRTLLVCSLLIVLSFKGVAQNVFDPSDPIVRYNSSSALGTAAHPNPDVPGLQKWVSVPVKGVSLDPGTWDASSFKQYFLNVNGTKMAFRMKFPKTYSSNPSKKFPIMLFLHGGGEVGCPSNGGIYNNERPIWLGGELFSDRVDNGQFDGFLLYPQLVISDPGCFAGWLQATTAELSAIISIIDSMGKYIRADIDRVSVDGLSGGGYGAWRMAEFFPQRIAKILPSASSGAVSNRLAFVHVPIWFATGGKDVDPSPEQAQEQLERMQAIGANVRYTQYPDLGHNMWYNHWREADFVPELNSAHKANPLIFFQHDAFCSPQDINAKLGITQNFYAYEWQKDGNYIATATNGLNLVLDPSSVVSFTGNEITVKDYGTYRVRFKRYESSGWSDWSPTPAVIKSKSTTQTPPIVIDGKHSKVLPAPDGSTTVPLAMPEGFINYQWYTDTSTSPVDTFRIYNAPVGTYKARYSETYGCGTEFSPLFKVIDANGEPKPDAASQLVATAVSNTSAHLTWTQTASPSNDETGFEIYRSTLSGGPFTFIDITSANAASFTDTGLHANTPYFYMVRAVNNTGAAEVSNKAPVKTLGDNTPPTAPSSLVVTPTENPNTVTLSWTASADDGGIARYDIYIDGQKVYTTSGTSYTISALDSIKAYTFVVKAYDNDGNASAPSNQVSYTREGGPVANPPKTPHNLVATTKSYSIIDLSWEDSASNETGFEIARTDVVSTPYRNVGVVGPNVTLFADSGLAPSKTYYYKIRAISSQGESDYTDTSSATTFDPPATPIPPTELAGDTGDSTSISMTWTDNSSNEDGYIVYRSTDSVNYTVLDTLPANTNAFTDTTASGRTTYYYYVTGFNDAGTGDPSNTLIVYANNRAPVITGLSTFSVKSDDTLAKDFTVTDDVGDSVTVTVPERPLFVSFYNLSGGKFRVIALPKTEDIGLHNVTIVASDNKGKSTTLQILVAVTNKDVKSVYLNFGNPGKQPATPWNNFTGLITDTSTLSALIDENAAPTTFAIKSNSNWTAMNAMGYITGDNSGIFPDVVLESGIMSSDTEPKSFTISGLDKDKQYNLAFVGSQNEGYTAVSEISTDSAHKVLSDARYNTERAASLNGLIPNEDGTLTFSIARSGNTSVSYLNGMVIEEYSKSVNLLNPQQLYVEAIDRNSVDLTWVDNSGNEDAENGYELIRATDSAFSGGKVVIALPGNTTAYKDTGLTANTNYYYHVRAKKGADYSGFSNKARVITPEAIEYVNFNSEVANAPAPWNNIASPSIVEYSTAPLKNQSGTSTSMTLSLVKVFNGEFTSGAVTGNNSGVVPDLVLKSNFWLDNSQISQFRVNELNHSRKYRVGFIGSSGPDNWYKGNYTAAYSIQGKTVYLNSWMNSTKIVYVNDVKPEDDGTLMLNFSTGPSGGYGFNAGVIIEQYTDTLKAIADSIPKYVPPIDPGDTTNPDDPDDPDDPEGVDPDDPVIYPPPMIDTQPPLDRFNGVAVYPNPFVNTLNVKFYNSVPNGRVTLDIYDAQGKMKFRRDFGNLPEGNIVLPVTSISVNMRVGTYIMTLRVDGKLVKSLKAVRIRQ